MKNILAIVMARGGSKGLPNKNILDLNGMPLIEHSIKWIHDYAKQDTENNIMTIVSTDIKGLEPMFRKYHKVVYYKRDHSLAQDDTRGEAVVHDVCKYVQWTEDMGDWYPKIDYVVLLMGNIPLRHNKLLKKSIAILDAEPDTDAVITFKKVEKYNPNWMTDLTEDYLPNTWLEEGYRRQDVKQKMIHDGHTCVFRYNYHVNFVKDHGLDYKGKMYEFFGNKIKPLVHNEPVIDIDTADDFSYAQYYFSTHC